MFLGSIADQNSVESYQLVLQRLASDKTFTSRALAVKNALKTCH